MVSTFEDVAPRRPTCRSWRRRYVRQTSPAKL